MNEKYDKMLVQAFPNLYKNRYANMRTTAMCWGFSCGDGWFPLIWEASKQLEKEIKKLPEEIRAYCTASQVKEKFGGLRIYVGSSSKEMDKIISLAERLSYKTCDVCGRAGETNGGGWISTRCQKHKEYRGEDKIHWLVLIRFYLRNPLSFCNFTKATKWQPDYTPPTGE